MIVHFLRGREFFVAYRQQNLQYGPAHYIKYLYKYDVRYNGRNLLYLIILLSYAFKYCYIMILNK